MEDSKISEILGKLNAIYVNSWMIVNFMNFVSSQEAVGYPEELEL